MPALEEGAEIKRTLRTTCFFMSCLNGFSPLSMLTKGQSNLNGSPGLLRPLAPRNDGLVRSVRCRRPLARQDPHPRVNLSQARPVDGESFPHCAKTANHFMSADKALGGS